MASCRGQTRHRYSHPNGGRMACGFLGLAPLLFDTERPTGGIKVLTKIKSENTAKKELTL